LISIEEEEKKRKRRDAELLRVIRFLVLVRGFLEDKASFFNSSTKLTDDSRDLVDLSSVEDHVLGCGSSFRIRELNGRIAEIKVVLGVRYLSGTSIPQHVPSFRRERDVCVHCGACNQTKNLSIKGVSITI